MDSQADTIEFENIDITDVKLVVQPPYEHRRSLLMVGIGVRKISEVDIERLLEMGTNVVRLKTSPSMKQEKDKLIQSFDKAASKLAEKHNIHDWPYSLAVELKASKVQTGLLEDKREKDVKIKEPVLRIWIEENSEIILTNKLSEFNKCNESQIFVDDPYLTSDVTVGMEINISQDEIIMVCTDKYDDSVKCTVTKGGYLQSVANVCMRGAVRNRPFLAKMDFHIIKFAMDHQVDMIIINYLRNIETFNRIKKIIGPKHSRPLIIPAISTQEGLMNIDDLLQEVDGILLSREFLPYEVESALYDRIGWIQNLIAGKCREAGKPFFISGGIFDETLKSGDISTREISDVTNAILQGATGFSVNETHDINNLFEAIKMFNELAPSVEPLCTDRREFWQLVSQSKMPVNAAEACALSCAVVANQTKARLIIVPTVSGRTAALINWFRPNSTIIAVSTATRTVRRLKTFRSVVPLLYKGTPRRSWNNTVNDRINFALQFALIKRWILAEDYYVTLEKGSEGSSFCDTVRVWQVTASKRSQLETYILTGKDTKDKNMKTLCYPPEKLAGDRHPTESQKPKFVCKAASTKKKLTN